jgi:hypothetical protein
MRLYAPRSLKLKTGLQVLALEQDSPPQASREPWRRIERRFAADVVHAAREDQPQHLFDGGRGAGRIGMGMSSQGPNIGSAGADAADY